MIVGILKSSCLVFLDTLYLYLDFKDGSIDECVLQVLPRLEVLKTLRMNDALRKFDTILEICKMQNSGDISKLCQLFTGFRILELKLLK